MVTFEDPDFDAGCATSLPIGEPYVLKIAVFSDNADTAPTFLVAEGGCGTEEAKLQLM